jgi:hypothetical protein
VRTWQSDLGEILALEDVLPQLLQHVNGHTARDRENYE